MDDCRSVGPEMKVFITGATGFIGGHLVRRLAGTGHEMRCLVRDTSLTDDTERHGAELYIGDVTDRSLLVEGMSGCDCLVHLANVYSMWERDRSVYRSVNVEGTRNVMESALEAGLSKAVHVSTAGVFGKAIDAPFNETSEVGPRRFSEYTRTKYEGDLIAWDLFERKRLPLVVIYPGAVLGLGDTKPTGRYIEDMAARSMPVRVYDNVVMTYVHVRDVAEAIVRVVERDDTIGEKYLIGNSRLSFRELNEIISDVSGAPPPAICLPGFLVTLTARILTSLSAVTGRPPPWGMSVDQANMAREGFIFDGSKAEKSLGIRYTPIRTAVEEALRAGGS